MVRPECRHRVRVVHCVHAHNNCCGRRSFGSALIDIDVCFVDDVTDVQIISSIHIGEISSSRERGRHSHRCQGCRKHILRLYLEFWNIYLDLLHCRRILNGGQVLWIKGSFSSSDVSIFRQQDYHGQFVPRPVASEEGARVARVMDWLRQRLAQHHSIASIAECAAMSPRTLQRQFAEASGLSPLEWLVRERVALAKEMLEGSRQPLARIAEATGLGSEESLRKHFRRLVGVSPAVYRQQFSAAQTSWQATCRPSTSRSSGTS